MCVCSEVQREKGDEEEKKDTLLFSSLPCSFSLPHSLSLSLSLCAFHTEHLKNGRILLLSSSYVCRVASPHLCTFFETLSLSLAPPLFSFSAFGARPHTAATASLLSSHQPRLLLIR